MHSVTHSVTKNVVRSALALLASVSIPSTTVAQQRQRALVFDGITVVDVQQGKVLPMQRVVIVGNRIRAVGEMRSVSLPPRAQVIDARGKFLIPGLWDMHTHSMEATALFYPLYIINGITGIRDAASSVPLATLRLWQREILAGTRIGPPRQIFAGKAIDAADAFCSSAATHHVCAADSADAVHKVDSLKAAGADFIKTWATHRHLWFVIAAEARRIGIPVQGHIPDETQAIEASDSGATILDHVDASGDLDVRCLGRAGTVEQCQPIADHFRRNGTWWCPTLIRKAPVLSDRAQAFLAQHETMAQRLTSDESIPHPWLRDSSSAGGPSHPSAASDSSGFFFVVHQLGFPILAGTDVFADQATFRRFPPGFSLHTELALYVAEGLTPLEALRTATLNPAMFLHATDSLGTIAPGKLADVVVLDGNPLADITNTTAIWGVVANGRYFDRMALDHLVAAAQITAKQLLR